MEAGWETIGRTQTVTGLNRKGGKSHSTAHGPLIVLQRGVAEGFVYQNPFVIMDEAYTDENEEKLINEEYKVWKKNTPFLYGGCIGA